MIDHDLELFRSLQNGNKKAFEILFKAYYEFLCKYSCTIVGSFAIAEDIVEEIFTHPG